MKTPDEAKMLRAFASFSMWTTSMVIALSVAASIADAASKPGWFPKNSCRTEWRGRDLARYKSEQDSKPTRLGNTGYLEYQQRLAKSGVVRKNCYKEWSVLVFMAGDNNLSPYALWDIDEMEGRFESSHHAGSTLKSDLVVELDTEGPDGIRRLHIFQREDQPYVAAKALSEFAHRTPVEIASPIVSMLSEGSGSIAQRFQDFLEWGVREFPAENYMVIVWGHGQGWSAGPKDPVVAVKPGGSSALAATVSVMQKLPASPRGQFGGVMTNPGKGDGLSIPQLRDALADVVENTLAGNPIANYVSDACLMQMAEVAYEIAPSVRFISGSAQVQSFLGIPYRRLMYELNSGRFLSVGGTVGKADQAMLVAKMLPILSEQSLDPIHGQQGRADATARETFTMSSLSSEALRFDLMPAIKKVSSALRVYLSEDFFRTIDISFATQSAPAFMGGGKELGSLLTLFEIARQKEITESGKESTGSRDLSIAVAGARAAIDRTVIERRFGTAYHSSSKQFHLLGYRGIGVWVPNGVREFNERSSDFALSTFEVDTEWQSWLRPALGIAP